MKRREPQYNPEPGVITVYSDVGCPWASLALHGLRRARREAGPRGDTVRIDLRAYPLELVNEQPTPRNVVGPATAVIGGTEPDLGWRVWQGSDWEWPVSTLLPMEAVQAAKRPAVGGLVASDELDEALRHAFFAESRCVTLLPAVLAVARECKHVDADALATALQLGAGRPEVITQWRNARDGAVAGSPHVFLPDGDEWINPAVEVRWTGAPGSAFPVIDAYDPTAYDEIVAAVLT